MVDRLHEMAAEVKEILLESVSCKKPLGLLRYGKIAHVIFLLAYGLMEDFDEVIGIDGIDVLNGRHDLLVYSVITVEFVCKEPVRFSTLTFKQASKEVNRHLLIASPLYESINSIAILMHRAP